MILAVKFDGSYRWQCDDCGTERNEYPHRGPRKSLCKRCQNIRYRAGRSPAGLPLSPLADSLASELRVLALNRFRGHPLTFPAAAAEMRQDLPEVGARATAIRCLGHRPSMVAPEP